MVFRIQFSGSRAMVVQTSVQSQQGRCTAGQPTQVSGGRVWARSFRVGREDVAAQHRSATLRGAVQERGGVGGMGWTYAVRIFFPACSAARHAAALEIMPDAKRMKPIKRNCQATFSTAPGCALPRVLSESEMRAKQAMSTSCAPPPSPNSTPLPSKPKKKSCPLAGWPLRSPLDASLHILGAQTRCMYLARLPCPALTTSRNSRVKSGRAAPLHTSSKTESASAHLSVAEAQTSMVKN